MRIMACPDQPFWRVFAEIVARLPINHSLGKDDDGRGRARLWKKVHATQISLGANKTSSGGSLGVNTTSSGSSR